MISHFPRILRRASTTAFSLHVPSLPRAARVRALTSLRPRASYALPNPSSQRARGLEALVLSFDKVPSREPIWGPGDGDDDDEEIEGGFPGQGGGGNQGGGGGGGGDGGGGGGDEGGFFKWLSALWTEAVLDRPVLVKATSTALISLLGDYCSQLIGAGGGEFELDKRRLAAIGIWTFMFLGPALHYWYGALDRVFFGAYAVWGKLAADQLLFAPLSNSSFIVGTGVLEGRGLQESWDGMKGAIWKSMLANWTLWPAAQFVNFSFVPLPYRILWVNATAFVWTILLTYISHEKEAGVIEQAEKKLERKVEKVKAKKWL